LEVEGYTPIAEPGEKIASLERKNTDQEHKINDYEKELRELRQQLENIDIAKDQSKVKRPIKELRLTTVTSIIKDSYDVFVWPRLDR
jgi:hypothetical protein